MALGHRQLWVLASLTIFAATLPLAVSALRNARVGHTDNARPRVGSGSGAHGHRPNFLVITTDDQTLSQFSPTVMPFTRQFFSERGSVFTNAIAAPPLCCPSRAGFLTGQYPHNHGVLTNDAGYSHLVENDNTLPVWLRRAGYRTALIGKYLNGYPALGPTVPSGWDEFVAAGGVIDYRDFDVGVNGEPRHYGGRNYSTSVDTRAAQRFLRTTASEDRPFFLWLTYNAPHSVPEGDPPCRGIRAQPETKADFRKFVNVQLPGGPALDERDVSDKGRWVRSQPPLSTRRRAVVERNWRCALSSLPSVDRGVSSLVDELRRLRQLERTIIVFTSDNGYFFGEHGIPNAKDLPYDEALRVPLAIWVPPNLDNVSPAADIDALVSNVDLAPTLLDYAGAKPCKNADECRTLDGHSLRSLLSSGAPPWTRNRAIPLELEDDFTYEALRTSNVLYMELIADRIGELSGPEIELYDLRDDPWQLHNLWADDRVASRRRQARLSARLHALTRCLGIHGARACE